MQSEAKRLEWSKLVKEFEGSNLSKKEWCKEKKISPHVFGYWFSIFRVDSENKNKVDGVLCNDNSTSRVAVTIEKEKISTSNWLELQLPKKECRNVIGASKSIEIRIGKAEISILAGFDKNLLKEVVSILGEI